MSDGTGGTKSLLLITLMNNNNLTWVINEVDLLARSHHVGKQEATFLGQAVGYLVLPHCL